MPRCPLVARSFSLSTTVATRPSPDKLPEPFAPEATRCWLQRVSMKWRRVKANNERRVQSSSSQKGRCALTGCGARRDWRCMDGTQRRGRAATRTHSNLPTHLRRCPPCPNSPLARDHRETIRSRSACTARFHPFPGRRAVALKGQAVRRAVKEACISAQRLRASALATGSPGQSAAWGCNSATYSEIDKLSQTARSPSKSTGTRPDAGVPASRWRQ
jgi:hypothetical protein